MIFIVITCCMSSALPSITFSISTLQLIEGRSYTVTTQTFDPGNTQSSITVKYMGTVIVNGTGDVVVVVTGNSSVDVLFSSVYRNMSGLYQVTVTNAVGNATASLELDVLCTYMKLHLICDVYV